MRTTSYNIPIEDRDFFTLLRIGLWQKVEEPLSDNSDWEHIFRLACEQTVQGIVADGLMLYEDHAAEHPDYARNVDEDVKERFLDHAASIVYRNTLISQKQEETTMLFSQQHLPHYVVKGQMAAANYPKPNLRCPGDIDILIRPNDFVRARDLLTPIADRVEKYDTFMMHQQFFIGDIEIELHGTLRPCLGKRIDSTIINLQQDLFDGNCNYETFCAVYLFLHCLQHFHESGLGIRQIIDWTMYLHACQSKIDCNLVVATIKQMKVQTAWNSFHDFATDWLGLSFTQNDISAIRESCVQKEANALRLWQACRATGNMGSKRLQLAISPNIIKRNLIAWRDKLSYSFRNYGVSPYTTLASLRQFTYVYCLAFRNKFRW